MSNDLIVIRDAPATILADPTPGITQVQDSSTEVVIIVDAEPTVLVYDPAAPIIALVAVGPAGPSGPPGPPGTAGATYTHYQITPVVAWSIPHPLAKHPSVTVQDSAGRQVLGEVQYLTDDLLRVTFRVAFSGRADLN
ncbi:hypothetical protein EKD04_009370 [Chloroflexales bacterium ZM16-3]|nr:hypothetical protein [Chloroflexales bacterium ZM16-3]